jgi:hypothetical protein
MAAVTSTKPQWRAILRPKGLCWHAFAVLAFIGMLWLGDWQWHCALSGNTLSWAYTFEWPLFAIFGVVFWVRTVRDEVGLTAISAARKAHEAGTSGAAVSPLSPLSPTGAVSAGADPSAGAGTEVPPGDDDAGLTRSHQRESESREEYAARLIAEIRGHDRGKRRAFR